MISDKKKKRKPVSLNEKELDALVEELVEDGLPEGIFGVLDNNLDRVADEAKREKQLKKLRERKPAKLKDRKPRALPHIPISKPGLPPEAEGVDVANIVKVPESLLRKIATGIDKRTAEASNLLLASLIPLMLSYDTSTSYAKAAMRDGLNVEIDFDSGLAEAVKHIGYLNVLFYYIKKSKLPVSVKKKFMYTFAEALSNQAMHALVDSNKIQDRQKISQELQAVVYSGQQRKTTVHKVDDKHHQQNTEGDTKPASSRMNAAAVKRRSR